MAHIYNSCTWKAEAGRSLQVRGRHGLYSQTLSQRHRDRKRHMWRQRHLGQAGSFPCKSLVPLVSQGTVFMVLSFLLFCDSLLIKSDLIPHVLIHYLTCLKKATCLYFIVYTLNINLIAVDVTEYEYKENGDYMCVCVCI